MDSSAIELPGPEDQGHNDNRPQPPRRSLLEDADHYSAFSWAIRYAYLVIEYPTPDILNGMKIWDVDVAYNVQAFVARERITQAFNFDDIDDNTDKAIITQMEPIKPDPPRASDAELIAELQTGKYTLQLARTDVSITQWAQRKASLAKQIGYNEDRLILQTIFPLIDIEISRFLSIPKKKTTLTAFIQECEERRPTINAMMLRDKQLSSRRSRQGQSFDRGSRYGRGDNARRGQQDGARDNRREDDGRRDEYSRRDGPRDDQQPGYRYSRPSSYDKDQRRGYDRPRDERRASYNDRRDRLLRDSDVKSEKKVRFEKKYLASEDTDNSQDADKEDNRSISDLSTSLTRSREAYFSAIT
ncbi:hypothetical protein EDB80DRAFT_874695 [Ilyonectria destructans]|nr:hypothetical protein EDB80DRAFT_874695 [Ilyonectria destructans]